MPDACTQLKEEYYAEETKKASTYNRKQKMLGTTGTQ